MEEGLYHLVVLAGMRLEARPRDYTVRSYGRSVQFKIRVSQTMADVDLTVPFTHQIELLRPDCAVCHIMSVCVRILFASDSTTASTTADAMQGSRDHGDVLGPFPKRRGAPRPRTAPWGGSGPL